MDKRELQILLKEKERRSQLKSYEKDFTSFAKDQIQIITKDASQGFIPFSFNECQKRITDALSQQLEETGKVRAIILKARQQGISTYCAGRVFWKTYYQKHSSCLLYTSDAADE